MFTKKDLVVKSNRIIEASYRLTLNEQRIILFSICKAREDQKGLFPDLPVTITAEAFCKQFTSVNQQNAYAQLKEAMDALYERSVTYYDLDPDTGKEKVNKTRWITRASYIDGAGHVQIIFTPDVIAHITRLEEEFTSYQLEKVGKMTSAYAIRLYELLAQYKSIGKREIELEWFKNALQIKPNEYKLTADFKKKVIDASISQINKHSDLKITYEIKKTGRAISAFIFNIKESTKSNKKTTKKTDQEVREALEKLGQTRIEDEEEF